MESNLDKFDKFLQALSINPGSGNEKETLLKLFDVWQQSTQATTTVPRFTIVQDTNTKTTTR
jgi:hypothetical protein